MLYPQYLLYTPGNHNIAQEKFTQYEVRACGLRAQHQRRPWPFSCEQHTPAPLTPRIGTQPPTNVTRPESHQPQPLLLFPLGWRRAGPDVQLMHRKPYAPQHNRCFPRLSLRFGIRRKGVRLRSSVSLLATTCILLRHATSGRMCHVCRPAAPQEDVRLPFFVTGPGVPRGVRVGNELQASMTDLTATLMWLAGG